MSEPSPGDAIDDVWENVRRAAFGWDPLGISDFTDVPVDSYDSLVIRAINELESGSDDDQIIRALHVESSGWLGFEPLPADSVGYQSDASVIADFLKAVRVHLSHQADLRLVTTARSKRRQEKPTSQTVSGR
ncbi:hypothetical protein [Microcella sp.]|uniref:hypothetical protein n=1 Tax=Microcella sp. TaxID=1913979 RepID=UPI00299F73A1|nr:hypothetical protein [Microcella sp.]MDX2026226.1 hypothetical protein [Microcella sp.]